MAVQAITLRRDPGNTTPKTARYSRCGTKFSSCVGGWCGLIIKFANQVQQSQTDLCSFEQLETTLSSPSHSLSG
eukprot:6859731-Alexandrium_andersonii.AAC.1